MPDMSGVQGQRVLVLPSSPPESSSQAVEKLCGQGLCCCTRTNAMIKYWNVTVRDPTCASPAYVHAPAAE